VRYLVTAEKANDQFITLSEHLPDAPSQIVCLTFANCELRGRHIQVIANIYQRLRIPGIRLVGELFPKYSLPFCRAMQPIETLKSLSIDACLEFSAFETLAYFERWPLEWFGVTRCGMELNIFFFNLDRRSISLKGLDVSGNVATRPLQRILALPPTLDRFVADDIEFGIEIFAQVLKTVFTTRRPIAVSLSNNHLKPGNVDEVFRALVAKVAPNSGFAVRELFWERNCITPGMFGTLERCERLRLLSLSGLRPGDDDARILTQFLASNCTVEELRIANTSPELLQAVFGCLRTGNRTVKVINVAENAFDKRLNNSLAELLLENCVIERVVMTFKQSEDFYRRLLPRGRPLVIDGDFSEPEIASLLDKLRAGDSEIIVPREALELSSRSVTALIERLESKSGGGPVVIRPSLEPDPNEWVCAIEPVPLPDNEVLMAEFRAENSIAALLAQIKSDA
jgi:hypothetical protein